MPYVVVDEAIKREAERLYLSGLTIQAVAREMHRSPNTIHGWLRLLETPLRPANNQKRKPIVDGKWECAQCKEWKPLAEFGIRQCNGRPSSWCFVCNRLYQFANRFGFDTVDEFQQIWDELWYNQQGLCALCCIPLDLDAYREIHLDHCHATGLIRGILCNLCNVGLGAFKDNPEALERASRYVRGERPSF